MKTLNINYTSCAFIDGALHSIRERFVKTGEPLTHEETTAILKGAKRYAAYLEKQERGS